MEDIRPDFLITPFDVISDKRLRPLDHSVYGVIYWFYAMKEGRCRAGNTRIAKILEVTPMSVSNSLTRLENAGKIKRLYDEENSQNRSEIIPLVTFGKSRNEEELEETPDVTKEEEIAEETQEGYIKQTRGSHHLMNRIRIMNYICIFLKKNTACLRKKYLFLHRSESITPRNTKKSLVKPLL